MASIRKLSSGKWIAEIRVKGKYLSKTHDSKGLADSWARTEEHRILRGTDVLEGKTLGQAMARYAKEVSPAKKGARWEIIRLEKLQKDEIAFVLLNDLRASDLDEWMQRYKDAGLKASSINRELNLISAVFTKCRKSWKWLSGNPMTDIERPKNPPARDKTYDDDTISRILLALDYTGEVRTQRHKIAVAFLLAIETAMRQGEIWGLLWSNISIPKRTAVLPDTKNGTSRDVPLSTKAVALLESLPRTGDRVFDIRQASAGVIFRRAAELAGIEGMTFHDTRHTAVTRMAKKLDMLTLARVTGHKDPRQLLVYYNPKAHDIAKLLD